MNYQQARKLSDGSGWHMTVRNDDRIWTHTCCCEQVPATIEDVERLRWIYHGSMKVGDLITGDPHPPHATKAEAEECFHQWRLGKIRETAEFDDAVFGSWEGCAVCDLPTKGGARYSDDHDREVIALCPDHREIEQVLSRIDRYTASAYS